MGDVYRAHDERLSRDVALKVLPTGLMDDRERLERFAQEAKSASALNHSNIVVIYEIGRTRPSFVVEKMAGQASGRKRFTTSPWSSWRGRRCASFSFRSRR
jgi:serine/threonine protein kinase